MKERFIVALQATGREYLRELNHVYADIYSVLALPNAPRAILLITSLLIFVLVVIFAATDLEKNILGLFPLDEYTADMFFHFIQRFIRNMIIQS